MNVEEILSQVSDMPVFFGIKNITVATRSPDSDTPLHIVVHWGDPQIVEALIEAGAEVNAVGDMGCTPIFAAIGKKDLPIIKLLIKFGAKLDQKNDFGHTPIDRARHLNIEIEGQGTEGQEKRK